MLSYLVRCSNCYLFQIFTVWFRKRQCYLIWSDALIAIFFRYLQFGSERDNAILFGSERDNAILFVRCSNCYLFQIFTVWFRKRLLSYLVRCYCYFSDIYSLVQKETMLSYLVRCSNCYLFQIFTVWFRKRQCYLIWSDALIAIFFRYLQFGSERDNAILFGQML